MTDEDYMQLAIEAAARAGAHGEVPVGAVVISPDGRVVATAANSPIADQDPTAHAEIAVIRAACRAAGNYRLPGHALYVTLEPCTMCAGAIANARMAKVVYGASDPKGGAVESGVQFFDSPTCHHRPEIVAGICAEPCAQMLKDFFKARRKS